MIYEVHSNRDQIRWYDETKSPSLSLIKESVEKTYEAVASKQNMMPYKLYVINDKVLNQGLYDMSKGTTGTVVTNTNLLTAPYQFIYTARLVTDMNDNVLRDLSLNHIQLPCDPEKYKTIGAARNVCIEIGMHSTILSGILIENGLDVSYTLCFTSDKNTWTDKGFDFLEDEVYFIMSTGYRDSDRYKSEQYKKPLIENVVKYIL